MRQIVPLLPGSGYLPEGITIIAPDPLADMNTTSESGALCADEKGATPLG